MESSVTKKYIPMTEPAFYTLLSLLESRHGYSIMQYTAKISGGRVNLGAGTLYGLLARLREDKLIEMVSAVGKRKTYSITFSGMAVLQSECERLHHQLSTAMSVISAESGESAAQKSTIL